MSAQYKVDRLITSGRVALFYEDYVLGIQYFNQAISLKPYLYEPWQLRAVAKFNLDDFKGAESDVSEAINLNPYIPLHYDLRGISRIRQKNYEGAIVDYTKAMSLEPSNQNFIYNRAICFMETKQYAKAHADIDTLVARWSKFASAYLLKAEILLNQKDTANAESWIAKSLDVDPYNAEAWRVRAHISMSHKSWSDADKYFSRSLHLKSKNADNYVNRAVCRLQLNNLRGAMEDYDMALDIAPDNFLAHYNRGLLRQQVGDDNRAIEDFNYVLKLEPDNMMALFNRATLLDRTGDLRAAVRDYSKVIEEFPNFWTGLHYRAACYRRLGMTAKAEMDEFRILKAQMDKRIGKQQRWSRKKLAELRKKSEIDPEKYNQLVVEDTTSTEHEYKSEYRGKVQNRRVKAEYQPYICMSIFKYEHNVGSYHPFEKTIDEINRNLAGVQLHIGTSDLKLNEEMLRQQSHVMDVIESQMAQSPDVSKAKDLVLARSVAYSVVQNYEDAMHDADVSLSIDSCNVLAWWQRAVCNAKIAEFEQGTTNTTSLRRHSVLSDFSNAEKYAPDNAYLYYCHATYLSSIADYDEAIKMYTKALQLDDRLAEAYYNRGLSYLAKGDNLNGVADMGKAGELGLYSAYSIIKANSKK